MNGTTPTTQETKRYFRSWLGLSAQFLVLAVVAVLGAAVASAAAQPGDYTAGLGLSAAAIGLGFIRLKHMLDGGPSGLGDFVLVDNTLSLWIAIPALIILAFIGLLIADAWKSGSMYAAGLGLFVASVGTLFLDLKRVFDRIDGGAR